MVRRVIGAAVVVALVVAAVIWWHRSAPTCRMRRPRRRRRESRSPPGPSRPRTCRSSCAASAPCRPTTRSRSRAGSTARSSRSLSPKARRSRRAIRCSRSIRGPFQAALDQAQAAKAEGRGAARQRPARPRRATASWSARASRSRQSYDQQKATGRRSSQAAIKGDQAQIDTAKLNLDYADIRSPIDGRTGARLVDIGNLVQATDNTGAGHDHPAQADLRQLHRAAGRRSTRSASSRRRRRSTVARLRRRRQDAAGRGQADPDRQPDRPGDRHDPPEGDLRQRRRAAVAGRVRQRAADPRRSRKDVADRAGADRAGRAPNGNYAYVIKPDNTVERRTVEVAAIAGRHRGHHQGAVAPARRSSSTASTG